MGQFHVLLLLVHVIVIWPLVCNSQDFVSSRATYYGSPDCKGTPRGACGFGEYGKEANEGRVTGVSHRLWTNGSRCGACYQVRCKIGQHCSEEGTYVVVTDYGEGDGTDFILSPRAYARMAREGTSEKLIFSLGVVDVDYRRVPCRFGGSNLLYKIHHHSYNPHYLAIIIWYVPGANDVLAVEIWQDDYKEWRRMRRAYGAVHDVANPPRGPITLRFLVYGSAGINWFPSPNPIPGDWSAGAIYDSYVELA